MKSPWRVAVFTILVPDYITHVGAEAPLGSAIDKIVERQEACNDDDYLQAFQRHRSVAVDYCSTLLGIKNRTVTASPVTVTRRALPSIWSMVSC